MSATAVDPRIHEAIVAELGGRGAKRYGKEIAFCCPLPGHDDDTPSASYNTDKCTWYCHACKMGYGALDLAVRLGIPLPERQTSQGQPRPRVVRTFDYRDVDGALLGHVDRIEPGRHGKRKEYLPRLPGVEPGDFKRYGLNGLELPLYRIDEVMAADPSAPVLIVEGEPKVDLLWSLGFVATCNAGGAGKWSLDFSLQLAGRHLVILPDADDAGAKHHDQVGALSSDVAASVRALDLPDLPAKGDVVDWRRNGGTAEQLADLLATAPAWTPPEQTPTGRITYLEDYVARLEAQLAERDQQIEEERRRRLEAERQVAEQKAITRSIRDVLANPKFKSHAAVYVTTVLEVQATQNRPTRNGKTGLSLACIGEGSGRSEKTASKQLKDLHNAGLIEKEVVKEWDADSRTSKDRLYIGLPSRPEAPAEKPRTAEVLSAARTATLPPNGKTGWGGRRVACPSCGSVNVKTVPVAIECLDCTWRHPDYVDSQDGNPNYVETDVVGESPSDTHLVNRHNIERVRKLRDLQPRPTRHRLRCRNYEDDDQGCQRPAATDQGYCIECTALGYGQEDVEVFA